MLRIVAVRVLLKWKKFGMEETVVRRRSRSWLRLEVAAKEAADSGLEGACTEHLDCGDDVGRGRAWVNSKG